MASERKQRESEFLKQIQRHIGILHKISRLYAGNLLSKDDLMQEMILQLWKSYSSFRGDSKFSSWMYRVALNTAISLNKRRPIFSFHKELPDLPFRAEETDRFFENIKMLYKALGHLNKTDKAVIFLWLEDKSYRMIAETTGLSEKNVSVRLVRIKTKLAEIIKKLQ